MRVQVYDDVACTKSPYGNRLASFFLDGSDPRTGVDKLIAAEKDFVHTYAYSVIYPSGNTQCNVTIAFKPTAGQRYKSRFSVQGNQCGVTVERYADAKGGSDTVPEETVRQIKPACVNNLTD